MFLHHQIITKTQKVITPIITTKFRRNSWFTTQEYVDEFSKVIDKFISNTKLKYQNTNTSIKNQVYISSNIPIKTPKKHHICTGWHTSDKRKR